MQGVQLTETCYLPARMNLHTSATPREANSHVMLKLTLRARLLKLSAHRSGHVYVAPSAGLLCWPGQA
eukprot:3292565-Amphidinium_carterae.2